MDWEKKKIIVPHVAEVESSEENGACCLIG